MSAIFAQMPIWDAAPAIKIFVYPVFNLTICSIIDAENVVISLLAVIPALARVAAAFAHKNIS